MKCLTSTVRSVFSGKPAAKARGVHLGLESLETRYCPSVTIATADSGHTLVITGDNAANTVTITQDDDDNEIKVQVAGGQTKFFNSNEITAVTVNLKGGDDKFTYKLGGGSDFLFDKIIFVQLGKGNDKATFDFATSGAAIKDKLTVAVAEDGGGDDTADITLGRVDGQDVFVRTRMEFGNDTVNVTLKDDLRTDSNVKLDLIDNNNLQLLFVVPIQLGGNDKYTIKADGGPSGDVDIADNAVLDIGVAAGDGQDLIDLKYEGELDGKLRVILNGNDGKDTVKAVFDLEDDSDGTLDVRVLGGKGADTLKLQIFNDVSIIQAIADGGDGNDSAIVTGNVTKVSC